MPTEQFTVEYGGADGYHYSDSCGEYFIHSSSFFVVGIYNTIYTGVFAIGLPLSGVTIQTARIWLRYPPTLQPMFTLKLVDITVPTNTQTDLEAAAETAVPSVTAYLATQLLPEGVSPIAYAPYDLSPAMVAQLQAIVDDPNNVGVVFHMTSDELDTSNITAYEWTGPSYTDPVGTYAPMIEITYTTNNGKIPYEYFYRMTSNV